MFVIADELGISRAQFEQFLRMMQGGAQFGGGSQQQSYGQRGGNGGWQQAQRGPTLEDACNVLGVKPTDDATTVKRAYRKLMSEHHPDKLVGQRAAAGDDGNGEAESAGDPESLGAHQRAARLLKTVRLLLRGEALVRAPRAAIHPPRVANLTVQHFHFQKTHFYAVLEITTGGGLAQSGFADHFVH